MRHAHFLVLTGRLNEFPLHELIETLRGQRKTGRLQVEFKAGPCALFFREGALIEATMGSLRGLEALSLALSLQQEDAAPFNFNPLVAPPEAPDAQADRATAFARESAAHARARVIEVEPEQQTARTASQAGRDDAHGRWSAADATIGPSGTSTAPPQLDAHPAAQLETRAAAPQLDYSAEAARPRALLPAAEEGALVERLARIETVVATQARRANIERAVYAALVALLIITALVWRGRETTSDNAATNVASAASVAALSSSATAPAGNDTAGTKGADSTRNNDGDATINTDARPTAVAERSEPTASGASASAPLVTVSSTNNAPNSSGAAPAVETLTAKPPARAADARTRQLPASETEATAGNGRQMATAADNQAVPSTANRTDRSGGHVVQVRMTVERGRVLRAEVSNPRAGMAAYEALALRMARQRRYPEEFSGQETLRLSVGQ
jgi:hypothetical protein